MIKIIDHKKMGRSQLSWLDSYFHFSFAEYYNEENIQFGILRVINDDLIKAGTGFDTHPHANMEIVTYIVDGELTHADSMDNERKLTRGQVQYMSAGTGVTHSELNKSSEVIRTLQIWILPDKAGHTPQYGDIPFKWEDRENKWLHIVSGNDENSPKAPINIHADMNIYVSYIDAGSKLDLQVKANRQAYIVIIEGEADIEGSMLHERDAMEIVEQDIGITATKNAHIIAFEMKKSN